MHTSDRLTAADFSYRRRDGTGWTNARFEQVWPDYHPQDRVGIVAPCLETGVVDGAPALLALTTAFYDGLRHRGEDFFDYPQHFAILDWTPAGVRTAQGRLALEPAAVGAAWGWLDVWPQTNWIGCSGTARDLLQQVFALQINRLFWPAGLRGEPQPPPLPGYAARLLRARLKSVHYYGAALGPDEADLEIGGTEIVEALIQESCQKLPVTPASLEAIRQELRPVRRYRAVSSDAFLAAVEDHFSV